MADIQELAETAMQYLNQLKIPYGTVSSLTVNSRAMRYGRCRRLPDGTFEIEISARLLRNDVDPKYARNTMIHELLHTCYRCMNHGKRWKSYIARVNDAFGFDISPTPYKSTDYSRERSKAVPPPREPKYVFQCRGCGIQTYRFRASDFTRNTDRYFCSKCGGKFKLISKRGD